MKFDWSNLKKSEDLIYFLNAIGRDDLVKKFKEDGFITATEVEKATIKLLKDDLNPYHVDVVPDNTPVIGWTYHESDRIIDCTKFEFEMLHLNEFGYEITDKNEDLGWVTFENKKEDTRIHIEFGDPDYRYPLIYVTSVSEQKDWYGDEYNEPMGIEAPTMMAAIEDGTRIAKEWGF